MKWFAVCLLALAFLGLFTVVASSGPPAVDEELGALVYSDSGLDSKECYLIFVGEREKPVKAPAESVVFKFDSRITEPRAKIWMIEKDVAQKAEIWFKDKDQLREYLR